MGLIQLTEVVAGAASTTRALPESSLLPLTALADGVTEASAAKLNDFLANVKNSMILVMVSPMPEDDQVEVNVRNGKDTTKIGADGKQTGQDNSQTPVSQTNTYAKVEDVKLTWTDPNFDPKARFTFQATITAKKSLDPSIPSS